jgi:hypothetical protein
VRSATASKPRAVDSAHEPPSSLPTMAADGLHRYNEAALLLGCVGQAVRSLQVERAGSQPEWARRTGVDRTYLNKVMSARKNPGPDLIRALKLKQVAAYAAQGSEQAHAQSSQRIPSSAARTRRGIAASQNDKAATYLIPVYQMRWRPRDEPERSS